MIETPKQRFAATANGKQFLELSATTAFAQGVESAFAQFAYELGARTDADRSAQLVGARRYMEILVDLAVKPEALKPPTSKNLNWKVK